MIKKILWKFGAVSPAILASTLLFVLIVPALPILAQVCLFYGGLVIAVLLARGVGEGLAVRILFHARRLSEVEQSALTPITAAANQHGLGPAVEFYIARRPVAALARAYGRRHVVIAPWIAHAIRSGQLPHEEAVAVLTHAVLVAQAGSRRHDPLIAFCTLPWRTVCAPTRPLRGLLPEFVWRARIVVFCVAIWQCATTGPPVLGPVSAAVLAVIAAMTYLTRPCARHWERHVTSLADGELVDRRLGLAMARFLRRLPPTGDLPRRLNRLETLSESRR